MQYHTISLNIQTINVQHGVTKGALGFASLGYAIKANILGNIRGLNSLPAEQRPSTV